LDVRSINNIDFEEDTPSFIPVSSNHKDNGDEIKSEESNPTMGKFKSLSEQYQIHQKHFGDEDIAFDNNRNLHNLFTDNQPKEGKASVNANNTKLKEEEPSIADLIT